MSLPLACKPLTPKQKESYARIISKEEPLNAKDEQTLQVLTTKMARWEDPELSVAAKKYMIRRYSWEKYNRGTIPTGNQSSFILKGNELEDDAIKFMCDRDKLEYAKGTDFVYNDYIFGRCDMFNDKKVIDVKISWGIHGFLPNLLSKLSIKYWLQMQGYLELHNIDYGEVCYILLNTPSYLIEREKAKHEEKYLLAEIDAEKFEDELDKLSLCYDYSKIPKKRKCITFGVHRDKEAMEKVYRKIEKCREWLSEFDKLHTNNKKIITLTDDYDIFAKENIADRDTDEPPENNPE